MELGKRGAGIREEHHSPTSEHCERVLETKPRCWAFREIRSWVLCEAWRLLETEKLQRLPVSRAWQEARARCVLE